MVWDLYTDHVSWTRWAGLGTVSLARTGDPPPNGVGCVRAISRGGFKVLEEVVSFDPPERMTYRVVGGMFPVKDHLGEVVFEEDGGGTLVTWSCEFNSKIPGLGGLLRVIVTKTFNDTLDALSRCELGA